MIEVGEYVRTHKGDIHKVIGIREEVKEGKRIYSHKAYYLDSRKGSLTEAFIIKHSKNIIDLIQVGDILKIEISKEWTDDEDRIKIIAVGPTFTKQEIIKNVEDGLYKIKSIVTKEQFASIEYKVKE